MGQGQQPGTARIELELVRGAEPIAGRIRDPEGSESAFIGWLELIGALQRIGGVAGRERGEVDRSKGPG